MPTMPASAALSDHVTPFLPSFTPIASPNSPVVSVIALSIPLMFLTPLTALKVSVR